MDPNAKINPNVDVLSRMITSLTEDNRSDFLPPGVDSLTGVTSKDAPIDPTTGVSARLFLPPKEAIPNKKLPILVYFHGGGFFEGSAMSAKATNHLNCLVSRTNVLCVSVDYRLAPPHSLPAAYDDAVAALKWVNSPLADAWITEYGDLNHVFLSGDSAGGNIAHHLAMLLEAHDIPTVEGVTLLCPYFWGTKPIDKETTNPLVRIPIGLAWILVGAELDHPWMNPLAEGAPSLKGLGCKRAFVCVAEKDVFKYRGLAHYEEGLKKSGWDGEADMEEYPGVDHVWFESDLDNEQTKKLMAKLANFYYKNI